MEVAKFLHEGVKDPRVRGALITVTAVEVTRDLSHATVFVSVLGSDTDRESILAGLASAAGHLRAHIGRALQLRVAPTIAFKFDESVARAARIETLLASIRPSDAPDDAPKSEGGPKADDGSKPDA
jgi:ribosome-binding factor A